MRVHVPERWQSLCSLSFDLCPQLPGRTSFLLKDSQFQENSSQQSSILNNVEKRIDLQICLAFQSEICYPPGDNINIDIMFGHQMSRCRVLSNEDSHPTWLLHQLMNMDKARGAALDMYPQQKVNVSGM